MVLCRTSWQGHSGKNHHRPAPRAVTSYRPAAPIDAAFVSEHIQLRLKSLRSTGDADQDWIAVAALASAYSEGVEATARIRISELSLHTGELRCLFDGTRPNAAAL